MRPEVPGPFAGCLSPSSRNRWCCLKCWYDMHLGGGSYTSLWGSHSWSPTVLSTPFSFCVDNAMISWISDYLTGCLSGQCDSVLSDVVVNDTGAPLLPFLFSLYTTEGRRCLHSHYGSKRRWWGIWRATNTYEWWEATEWTGHLILKQCTRHVDFMKKVRSFNTCCKILEIFFQSVVHTAFSLLCVLGP